jgi:adenosylcobinamide amidohydrolase
MAGELLGVTQHDRVEDGRSWPVAVWRPAAPVRVAASTVLGGGIGLRHWVLNAQVPRTYRRLDPDEHLRELAAAAPTVLAGEGVGMLTAVDVRDGVAACDGGVEVVATVGLGWPTWAAAPDGDPGPPIGTINIVVALPVALTDGALVNAVATATEAKVQALFDAGVAATGTASDAICVAAATTGRPELFAGPRAPWGARLARAVHAAVLAGARTYRLPTLG